MNIAVYHGEEEAIIRGKSRIINDEKEFIKRTQDHIDKYGLKLDEHGRYSMGIPLFDKNVRCVIEVIPKRTIF